MLSPAVTRMVGTVGVMVSFDEGHDLLQGLAGVDVTTKNVERAAEALGREIADDERRAPQRPSTDEPITPTMYLGMDGTGVPMRTSELKGREGKQPDDTPSDFAARAMREATRRDFDRAPRRVVLGDGAPWIWNLADVYFRGAIQIVDRFHVKQHLSDVSKSIYGAGSELSAQWARKRHDELDAGDIEAILAALRIHAPKDHQARKCVEYIDGNRERMRYPEFRAAGLCTSTGVVEAGCKVAIGTRCKRSGMHWTVQGVDAIIALRCCKLRGLLGAPVSSQGTRRVTSMKYLAMRGPGRVKWGPSPWPSPRSRGARG